MSDARFTFHRGAIRPVQCVREAWQLVKDDYWLFLGITVVGMLIGSFAPLAILLGPMMCGIYICMLRRLDGRRIDFSMLFRGFNYFVPSMVVTLLSVVPMLFLLLPCAYAIPILGVMNIIPANPQGPPDLSDVVYAGSLITLFVLAVFVLGSVQSAVFFFAYPLIIDRELGAMQAIWTSFKAAGANLRGIVALALINSLLSFLGVMACYVGIFLEMPLHLAIVAVAYRQVFPIVDLGGPPTNDDSVDGPLPRVVTLADSDAPAPGDAEAGATDIKALP
jgi:hypothetical protein